MRSPMSPHTIASPRPAMPGASRFRETEQVEPSRWTGPTHVSYPTSVISGVPPRARADTLSTFAPVQVSTPAPERQESHSDNRDPPRIPGGYGVADEESFSRVEDRGQSAMYDREPYYDEYAEEDDREEEEDFEAVTVPDSAGDEDATQHYEIQGDIEVKKKGGKRKKFMGGFVLGLRNVPKLISRSQPQPVSNDRAQFAPQFNRPSQPPPVLNTPPKIPRVTESPSHPVSPPHSSFAPSYAQEDSTQSSNTTSSQMVLTPTPSQAGDLELPNPHDSRLESPNIVDEPEQAEIQPASDYDAMTPPIHTIDPFESTFSSQVNRVGKAISNFVHLPWIGSQVSAPYSPLLSRRARYKDLKKAGPSWYTKEIQEKVDLLAASPQLQPRSRPVARPHQDNRDGPSRERAPRVPRARRSPSRDAATAIRPTQTPRSITSAGAAHPSPGLSSHGHGHHSYSYSYHYPNPTHGMTMPQPIIIYPGPSPMMAPANPAADGAPPPSLSRPDSQQQAQQFMYYTAPATFIVPTSPDGLRRSGSRQYHPQFPVPIIMTPPGQTLPTPTSNTSPPQRGSSPRTAPETQPFSPRQQEKRPLHEKTPAPGS